VEAPRLRPHTYLSRRALGATLAFFTPVIIVLYYVTVPDGPWLIVVVAQAVVTVVFTWAYISYLLVAVWVTHDSIIERGFAGRTTRFIAAQLGSIVIVDTYRAGSVDTIPQLFISDPAGKQVLRLRGQYWSRETMQTIAATLDVPHIVIENPLTIAEVRARFPGLLYWYEQRPTLAATLFAGMLALSAAVAYIVLMLLGVTAG
jgi:hypothetical protein